jgi:SepF-like predicted cell division protein (DUF552 family)
VLRCSVCRRVCIHQEVTLTVLDINTTSRLIHSSNTDSMGNILRMDIHKLHRQDVMNTRIQVNIRSIGRAGSTRLATRSAIPTAITAWCATPTMIVVDSRVLLIGKRREMKL